MSQIKRRQSTNFLFRAERALRTAQTSRDATTCIAYLGELSKTESAVFLVLLFVSGYRVGWNFATLTCTDFRTILPITRYKLRTGGHLVAVIVICIGFTCL